MSYPKVLEQWWIKFACRSLGVQDEKSAVRRLEKEVQLLSDIFTTGRETGFQNYGSNKKLLLAYGLFFYPQTFARIQFPIREAFQFRGVKLSEGTIEILDLGCGLGSASMGSIGALRECGINNPVSVTGLDQSVASLDLFRTIASDTLSQWPGVSFKQVQGQLTGDFADFDKKFDLVLCSFAVGEAFFNQPATEFANWTEQVMDRLVKPGGLLIITEPSLQETSKRVEQARNLISERNRHFIWGPCLHHKECPLLKEGIYWCHEVRKWTPPSSLRSLNSNLYRSIETVKFSFMILGHHPAGEILSGPGQLRMISPMTELKGKFTFAGCASDGEKYQYEILTRHLTKSDEKTLEKFERGDILTMEELLPLKSGHHFRVPGLNSITSRYHPQIPHTPPTV
ncbi:MAG: small ribosomal subunit Rsm22 family protein [Verrucomicrobiota bacterium]|nr:small ribosomal subunit Rsm22 family protein [Verrucomicrobiota bacterium]